ncbi:hypothetical protein pb186bvf_012899 [Paramecium bursaria]
MTIQEIIRDQVVHLSTQTINTFFLQNYVFNIYFYEISFSMTHWFRIIITINQNSKGIQISSDRVIIQHQSDTQQIQYIVQKS